MRVILSLVFVFILGANAKLTVLESSANADLKQCFTNIIEKYVFISKSLTYVNIVTDGDILLSSIHSLGKISVLMKSPPQWKDYIKTPLPTTVRLNRAYVIVAKDVLEFRNNILYLDREQSWNPYVRFLVVIKILDRDTLRQVFNVLLRLRVNNVVVLNGTSASELYTYNPFDKFACGNYYNEIIELGKCLDVTKNIYPEKITTGLRNCFFRVSVSYRPPLTVDPATDKNSPLGIEQFMFDLMSEVENFNYTFEYNYDHNEFSRVYPNGTVTGDLLRLTNNLTDVIMGGFVLLHSRVNKFYYLNGYSDNADEIRIMVKKAQETPPWKDFYLVFSPLVWGSLLFAFLVYSLLMTILLRAEDKGYVVLILLDNLLSHGPKFKCRQSVKCVFIIWVLFAYLMNCYYSTTLMSLTTKPSVGYQIHDDETLQKSDLKPCLSRLMNNIRLSDFLSELNHGKILQYVALDEKECQMFIDSIKTVSKSYDKFTIAPYFAYSYNNEQFYDVYGNSLVYLFKKPYSKVIYAMYFNKGFPMYERLHILALRIREAGLAQKILNDNTYNKQIKYKFREHDISARFAIPWLPYIVGLFISSVVFVIELTYHRTRATF